MANDGKSLADLGTEKYPLRASSLHDLTSCDWGYVLKNFSDLIDRDGSEAADTGIASGRVIELWHSGKKLLEAFSITQQESINGTPRPEQKGPSHPFPLADWDTVKKLCGAYTADPANFPENVQVIWQEREILLQLPPHDLDQTRQPVWIRGHIDQVRVRPDGRRELWDLKAGESPGNSMLQIAALQQAAYLVGLNQMNQGVTPGGIIRLKGYTARKNKQVFWAYEWPNEYFRAILDSVLLKVALVRAGEVSPCPGIHCALCGIKDPMECLRLLFNPSAI